MSVSVPQSLPEVFLALEQRPDAELLAGGTDFMVEVNFGHRHPAAVVALREVSELGGWRLEPDHVAIGACCTYAELEQPELAAVLPALAQAARTVGSPQSWLRGSLSALNNLGSIPWPKPNRS